jgi:hypothetical protein
VLGGGAVDTSTGANCEDGGTVSGAIGAAMSVHSSETEEAGADGGIESDATEAVTGMKCGACEGVDEMG